MGARVALEIVAQASTRVDRIALLDTGVHPATPDEPLATSGPWSTSARGRGCALWRTSGLPPMVRNGALDADPALRDRLNAMVERMTPEIHRGQIAALLGRPDARGLLGSITVPVLIGVGDQESLESAGPA